MPDEFGWDIDAGEDGEYGERVPIEHPFILNNDIEKFLMSLPPDEGRVMVVRALGLQGEKAAEIGGFKSVWVYIRKLKKLQARARAQIGEAFQL